MINNENKFAYLFTFDSILKDVGIILAAFIIMITMALLRGGHGMDSLIGIDTCSALSWIILVAAHAGCFALSYLAYQKHETRLFGQGQTDNMGRPCLSKSLIYRP